MPDPIGTFLIDPAGPLLSDPASGALLTVGPVSFPIGPPPPNDFAVSFPWLVIGRNRPVFDGNNSQMISGKFLTDGGNLLSDQDSLLTDGPIVQTVGDLYRYV